MIQVEEFVCNYCGNMELDSNNYFLDIDGIPFCNIKHYLESFKFRDLEILKTHISIDKRLKVD